ncbi:MAG TPA: rhodanese-like domain-containing protein, partial [Balneolaceae bacterium]|nr:rhodanese-like domain-containing protein [Balneolaceae bacterium]
NDKNPPDFDGGSYVICHSHYGYLEDYQKGHIPGAIALDTNLLESSEAWNRRSPEELEEALEDLGIRHDTTVVVYGRFSAPVYDEEEFPGKSAGHLGAMRCAAIMMYAGVKDVRILNGGITSWENAGYSLSTDDVSPEPVADFGISIPAHPEYIIDMPEAKQLIQSPEGELVSVRSRREFIGEYSGYHYIEKKGRIPGAVFGNGGSDAYHMENYRNFDHTIREASDIIGKWAEIGITPDKRIAFFCGTGWRGSEAFINAYLMGWNNMAVYDGGWYEWSSEPGNPIETGLPE